MFEFFEQIRLAGRAFSEFSTALFNPTIRLGVTGLSRAGKTVFITALIHALTRGGRFPVFEALATGRIARAQLSPQPDDAVPRFDYEGHVEALVNKRNWPDSTRQISELRVIIDYLRGKLAHQPMQCINIGRKRGEIEIHAPEFNTGRQ